MDTPPPPIDAAIESSPSSSVGRKILWSAFALATVGPPAWVLGAVANGIATYFLPDNWRGNDFVLFQVIPAVVAVLGTASVVRAGLRQDWPAQNGKLFGWGFAGVAVAALTALAAWGFSEVRNSSRLKAMLPRQLAAAVDQFYFENPDRIFIRYDELVGPERYIQTVRPVDGEDLSVQFPIRQGWMQPLKVRLPDGTTVERMDVLAAVGRSGLVITYPQPEDARYDPKRVYRLDSGVTFRNWRVVNLPPDPAGREGRDQDGVHVYSLGDGRRYEITYRGGVPDGPFRAFYADGKPWGEATYHRGRVTEAWLITRQAHRFDELNNAAAASAALTGEAKAQSARLTQRGREKLAAKDYAGAVADFSAAVESYGFSSTYLARSDAREKLGDSPGAFADAKLARDAAETEGEREAAKRRMQELSTRPAGPGLRQ